jgi:predicted HD phosphohydrolase
MEELRGEDWALLERQRGRYYAEHQAAEVLRMLAGSAHLPSFGYEINNYGHSLQAATLAKSAGLDEETVVVALLHDIGFVACPATHGEFAAALLGPYISPRNDWMLRHHQIFQDVHVHDHPTIDQNSRETYRGHPFFEWTAEFVARFDQNTMSATCDTMPLDAFVPMVHRIFSRPPRAPSTS